MRVFYPYVVMPEKPQIARALQSELGWDPVLWVSPKSQHEAVQGLFPGIHMQSVEDAFYGRPFPRLKEHPRHAPDSGTWTRLHAQIPTMLWMMNYYGPPDSFTYIDRDRFARELLLLWNDAIQELQPDLVYFEEAPHAPHTWALYALCLEYGIPTPFFFPTAVPTFSVLKDRVDGPVLRIPEMMSMPPTATTAAAIHTEVAQTVDGLVEGSEFSHWYMRRQQLEEGPSAEQPADRMASVARAAQRIVQVPRWPQYAMTLVKRQFEQRELEKRMAREHSEWILLKHPDRPLGKPPLTLAEFETYKQESARRKAVLKADYLSRCVEPEIDQPFVYLALHYQPERTTDSDGGVYRDQYLVALSIHEALPAGWLLLVKEHPSQFAEVLHGDKARTPQFYEDLERLEHVRLINPDYQSKELVLNSRAVATVTGTVGWEAVLNGKHCLAFGFPWYEGCPGVHLVRSVSDVADAFKHASEPIAQADIERYLAALSNGGFRVDLNAWIRGAEEGLSQQEQVDGTLAAMTWWTKRAEVRDAQP